MSISRNYSRVDEEEDENDGEENIPAPVASKKKRKSGVARNIAVANRKQIKTKSTKKITIAPKARDKSAAKASNKSSTQNAGRGKVMEFAKGGRVTGSPKRRQGSAVSNKKKQRRKS